MENPFGSSIYRYAYIQKATRSIKFANFALLVLIALVFFLGIVVGHLEYEANSLKRPPTHIYYFIPLSKKDTALKLTYWKSLKYIEPDSVKQLILQK